MFYHADCAQAADRSVLHFRRQYKSCVNTCGMFWPALQYVPRVLGDVGATNGEASTGGAAAMA